MKKETPLDIPFFNTSERCGLIAALAVMSYAAVAAGRVDFAILFFGVALALLKTPLKNATLLALNGGILGTALRLFQRRRK